MGYRPNWVVGVMLVAALLSFPPVVYASVDWGSVVSSIDLTAILKIAAGLVVGVLGWVATKAQQAKARAEAENANAARFALALARLGVIGSAMLGRAWDKLSPVLQNSLADGKLTAIERLEIEKMVGELVKDFTSADDLEDIAEALNLPLAGVIAKIASFLIERFAAAHDPDILAVSSGAYPVTDTDRLAIPSDG
jgi:hypothetical protein